MPEFLPVAFSSNKQKNQNGERTLQKLANRKNSMSTHLIRDNTKKADNNWKQNNTDKCKRNIPHFRCSLENNNTKQWIISFIPYFGTSKICSKGD